ncbi:hypothetical protein AWC05_18580 [Mycobacterium florentinum]|uniref:Uncharacterized protein n=1 Tax=Mycobacterium florentinum TaxID=292462 RepID=A0A1X1UCM3_MYCFL|nr:BTAD domain-containing putative transcriptional regulator [Mycobacterium florentinum]ORV54593.1 hypothetical protein AWC05_18580 [Mycobacterium florentinum]BBX82013.1 hypothetical protein MFLOJ_58000 [Mycobacterium florentinum]
MELGVLGPLQVRQDGTPVAIPGAKPRAILTMLGLHDGSVVPADVLIKLLWGDDPPRTAAKALQTHISSLRRALGDGLVVTEGAGWRLDGADVDASRYKLAAKAGRDAATVGDTNQAAVRLEEALVLWRGVPELPDGQRGLSEKTRWIESHAALVEDRADALLATGRAAEVIGDLEAAVAEAPLRERRWGQLMLALYRGGRQGEALAAYQRARSLLADELGVDPGPELRRLETAIVAQDTSLDVAVTQHLPSVTRAVTFLLTDIEGSTAAWEADADAMARALARHDELVEQVVTSRGGRLIKTRGEGDATFSVFERPSAAAAAAIELQDAITHEPWTSREPIRVRMALHTGEAELRDGDYFGRAVNRVARLRSLAEGGQILCSGATAELVIDSLADDVMLNDLGMRQLKNLVRPEHVFELRLETASAQPESQTAEPPMERPGLPAVLVGPGPFVGRGRELERLLSVWQAALAGGVPTVLIAGEPGVGKTRLAGEWSQRAYAQGAVVLYGRCDEDLGAPYQPFAEALRSLVPCMGADRLRGLRGADALLALVPGLSDVVPDLSPRAHPDPDTERYALFDAVVALLEIASKSAPVLLILDDLHWAAKPTLLLLRHLLRFGDHARVQIVGTYRSTDLDRSHPLAATLADLHRDGTANRLSLTGLDEEDVTTYVAEAGYDDDELAHALASVTGGNPFFLIEALRHIDESGGVWDQSTLPQGVREAVSRRLSRLPVETNKALAAAAVVGSRFALELVESVVGGDLIDAFDEACQAGIVIEEPGGNYRFNHAIVRQSLLAELASVRRMRLHQRIAATLETLPGADDELLAELAHHYYECAWAGNAAKAVFYCRRAADQAMARLAYEGAADLYRHALHSLEELDDELPDRDDQTAELLIARCEALLAAGDVVTAAGAVAQLQETTIDSARLAAWATCFDGQLSMLIHPERLDEAEVALGAAAAKLAQLDDANGEAKAHTVRAGCLARLGRIGDCEIALDDALTAARRAREHRRVNAVLAGAPLAALWGPNPVPRAGGRCLDVVRLLRITTDSPAVEATSTRCQAVLEAFRGRAAAARRMIDSARRTVVELGLRHARLEVEQFAGIVELIVGDPAAAEPPLRKAYNGFRRMGLDADTAETAALLGRACLALDRVAESDELCSESERLAGHALKASMGWRTLRAHLLARGGDHEEARRVAEAAVTLAERTDALVDHGDACLTLATVLAAAGNVAGARASAEQAVGLYERKGAAALAEMARGLLGRRVEQPVAPSARPEPSHVEFDNACVRAVARGDAAFHRGAFDEFEGYFADDIFFESRRKILGFASADLRSGRWPYDARRSLELDGMVQLRRTLVAVRGERLALYKTELGNADVSPGAPREELLQLIGIDEDGRFALDVWFDIDDIDGATAELDAAHARFEEAQPPARRLKNAATRVHERLFSDFAARNWDVITQVVADNYSIDDRRRVVNTGIRYGRVAGIDELRAAADVGMEINMLAVIAIRGERLALIHTHASGRDSETIASDAINVVEIDTDGRIAADVVFDPDDFDAAIAELETRYLAGEAAANAHAWSIIAGAYAALNRHEFPATTADWVNIDHRGEAAFGPGDLVAYLRAGLDAEQETRIYIEAVHRVADLGVVITYAAQETSQEGFDAEWRGITILMVDSDKISRSEVFDEAELDAALARFEQLSRPARRPENAATRVYDRFWSHFAARDWDAVTETLAESVSGMDHRRVVNAGMRGGRDAVIDDLRVAAELFSISMLDVVAIRGGRLALTRVRAAGRDPETVQNDAFNLIEIDADKRITLVDIFDLDDVDAAFNDLEARYLTGEAAPYAHMWTITTENYAALSRHELPPMTADAVTIDHRRAAAFAPGEFLQYLRAAIDQSQRTNIHPTIVHRLNELGTVITHTAQVTSNAGFDAEFQDVIVSTLVGNRVNHFELFDEADLDAALARFEELSRPVYRLENTASRLGEQFMRHLVAQNWDAMTQMMSDDFWSDDRRAVVGAGIRHGRDGQIADMRVIADIGLTTVAPHVIATRGDSLALTRVRFAFRGQDAAEFLTEVVGIAEIDANQQIAAIASFEPDDIDSAIAELDARYLAGEAAAHAHTWSVIMETFAALNRHEPLPTTPEFVSVDHRRTVAFAPGQLLAFVSTGSELDHDTTHAEAVHRLSNLGAVITFVTHGTSKEGFDAEWRAIAVSIIDSEKVSRCELFDEEDLDAAIARFEELHPTARGLENTASRASARYLERVVARDWEAAAEVLADDYYTDDRRHLTGGGVYGRDAEIVSAQAQVDVGTTQISQTVIAVRGERLALSRLRYAAYEHGLEGFVVEILIVVEANADGRCAATVAFDLDNIDAAFAELDARYLAAEAAAHADTWSVITQGFAVLNRREMPQTTPDWVNIDHRRGTSIAPGEMSTVLNAAWEHASDLRSFIESVHRLNDLGCVITHVAHETSQEGFYTEWRVVSVLTVEGDLVNRGEVFDEADLDAALARFDELQPQAPPLENAASRAVARLWTCFATQDWAALADTMIDDFWSHDHRRVVNAGVMRGRDVHVANMRTVAEVGFEAIASTVIATRGQYLALSRVWSSAHDFEPGETSADMLGIVQADGNNRLTTAALFDAEDIDAAFEELDAQYLAVEAAPHAHTWSIIARGFVALGRGEMPAITTDFVDIDHRRGPLAPGELIEYLRASFDDIKSNRIYLEAVHRLAGSCAVVTHVARNTSHRGFDAEWHVTDVITVDGDLISRVEMFDEADLDAALARFDELCSRPPQLENTASQLVERFQAYYAAGDWTAMSETLADNTSADDRRRVVGTGLRLGRDAAIADMRAIAELGRTDISSTVIATRGDRLALGRFVFSGRDQGPAFFTETLGVVEANSDNRIVAQISFDTDDVAAAFAELEARYLAGEAAAYSRTWSAITRVFEMINRGEMPTTTEDFEDIDHRRGALLAPGDLSQYLRVSLNDSARSHVYPVCVHRLTDRGAVVTHAAQGTSRGGFEAEWRMTDVFIVDGDLIKRYEFFDEADLDVALARFEELDT